MTAVCASTLRRVSRSRSTGSSSTRRDMHTFNIPSMESHSFQHPHLSPASSHRSSSAAATARIPISMRTRAAVLANLPTAISDPSLCALASLAQWDSLPPGGHHTTSSSPPRASRVQKQDKVVRQQAESSRSTQQPIGASSRYQGREAELEVELRQTRDELAAAKAWMREASERLGTPLPTFSQAQ